jgi:hypothetical protein
MCDIAEICRPVLFKQNDPIYCYGGAGSSFLIGSSDNYYLVAARHSVNNPFGSINALKIKPSDNAEIFLPFDGGYGLLNLEDKVEYEDIYIARVNLVEFDESCDGVLKAQDIDNGFFAANDLLQDEELFVVGYPVESNEVDYDARKIKNTRVVLKAKYVGCSESLDDYCHQIIVNSSIKLKSFNGLSGGPVFCIRDQLVDGVLLTRYLLVGMITRGTASSGILHFIGAEVIKNIVDKVENILT